MAVAQKYQDQLKRIKDNIESAYIDFKANRERFYEWMNFTFNTSITDDEKGVLRILGKPQIECNIGEAFISRLCGEYAQQQPSLNVSSADGETVDPKLLEFLDGHFRWLMYEANNDGFQYNVYGEQLGGGFSAMEVFTEYESPRSRNQVIRFGKPDDVTMTFFDPLARKPHKGDGRFWGKLYPKTKEDFEEEYSDINIDDIPFVKGIGGFDWSYTTSKNQKILLMCDYYEKKKRKTKLFTLADNTSLLEDEYENYIAQWNEAIQKGLTVQQPPAIIDERKTEVTTICRYVLIENKILEYEETDFSHLNGIFVDGNSKWIKRNEYGGSQQMTRPYAYQGKGIQRLKNFAMQTLGNELENLSQQPWMMAEESLPSQEEYKEMWSNPQAPGLLLFSAYWNKNVDKPLPSPQRVMRTDIPGEIIQTFMMCDQAMQVVLGSYDASLGINDNQLSGKAIIAGASQSNAAAMPFIVSNLQALNQLGQIYIDLVPKYYKTPRSLPVIDKQGKRSYVTVNANSGVNLNYDSSKLHVRVEAGVNFEVQKQQSLQQIVALSQGEQVFSQFINTKCLDILVDNLTIRGSDIMKERAEQFMAQMQQQQAQASKMPNPLQIKAQIEQQKLMQQQQENQTDTQLRTAHLQNDAYSNETARLEVILDAEQANRKDVVEMAKSSAEDLRSRAELGLKTHDQALKHHDQLHRHVKEAIELDHQLNQPQPTTGGANT